MEKEKKRNLPVVKYIIIIIVLANVLISVVPTLIDSAGDLFGESETESYSDLRIINVSSQVVPVSRDGQPETGIRCTGLI